MAKIKFRLAIVVASVLGFFYGISFLKVPVMRLASMLGF